MIKTKWVYDKVEPEDGLRVLVMRKWPRGVKKTNVDVWWPQLGPSKELLTDWKLMWRPPPDASPARPYSLTRRRDITWEEYEERYRLEMEALPAQILRSGIWNYGTDLVGVHDITLLCVEKEDDPHCHRHILKKLIEGD